MTGYVKLFQSILGSSVWAGPDGDLRVWIAILALKDKTHIVRISPPGLATIARVSLEQCRSAIEKFKSPDPDSTSKEFEGRKIKDLPEGGFLVLNGSKYAKMLSLEERREYQRIKQAEYRDRRKGKLLPGEAGHLRLEQSGATQEVLDRHTQNHLPPSTEPAYPTQPMVSATKTCQSCGRDTNGDPLCSICKGDDEDFSGLTGSSESPG